MEICAVYIQRLNKNYEKQIIALMIPNKDEESWHYLSVKNTITINRNNI